MGRGLTLGRKGERYVGWRAQDAQGGKKPNHRRDRKIITNRKKREPQTEQTKKEEA